MLEELGVPVICLDELSRFVVRPGAPALDDIRRAFGDEFITEAGELDREVMGRAVFNDPEKRKLLESIIHPRVGEEWARRAEEYRQLGHPVTVVDIPLLYEVKWDRHCDRVVVVYIPKEEQERRLIERDEMTKEEARSRLDAQIPIEEKREWADFVIDNTGTLSETRSQVEDVLEKIRLSHENEKRADEGSGAAKG